jgi:6-phosphogluconolactonase/glucosamine-6-phosphate isomerase/deaminase
LTRARSIVVFASGAGKANAVAEVLENDESELPLALATMGEGAVTFLLDPAAGSKVRR